MNSRFHLEFLLKLSDKIRLLPNTSEIQSVACNLVGTYFNADRVFFTIVDKEQHFGIIEEEYLKGNLPPLAGSYRLSDFSSLLKNLLAGKPFISLDVDNENITEKEKKLFQNAAFGSLVCMPLIKNKLLTCVLTIGHHHVRNWMNDEIKLAKEIIERTCAVAEIVKTEKALKKSEENYSAIVNQSIAGIFKTDLAGSIIFSNEYFGKMLGYSVEELTNLAVTDIIHKDDLDRTMQLFAKLVDEGTAFEIEKRLIKKNGEFIWVNNHIAPLYNSHLKPHAAVAVSIDISQQKALDAQKDEFIGVASHELKTPITSIKSYIELLKDSHKKENNQTFNIALSSKLDKQTDKMILLVNALFETTKMIEGDVKLNYSFFSVEDAVNDIVNEIKITTATHPILIEIKKDVEIYADKEAINRILHNLISNAIKYSAAGSAIIISAKTDENNTLIAVRDFGIGIKPAIKKKIFERFYRANDSRVLTSTGLGLGLSIAAELVRRHHGTLNVDSQENAGATFYFTIPKKINME